MGRPRLTDEAARRRPYGVSLNLAERAKFRRLGGSRWLRLVIEQTPEPKPARRAQ